MRDVWYWRREFISSMLMLLCISSTILLITRCLMFPYDLIELQDIAGFAGLSLIAFLLSYVINPRPDKES